MEPVEIPLTQGKFALIDAEDVRLVASHRWSAYRSRNTWYARTSIGNKTVYMHRFLLFGERAIETRCKVDHKNHDGLDNRRANLRSVTHRENSLNSVGKLAVRHSQYKGVAVRKHPLKPFRASIEVFGRQLHLGYFATDVEAARAYDTAARHHFGQYAYVNFPESIAA